MKYLLSIFMVAFATVACAKEEPKADTAKVTAAAKVDSAKPSDKKEENDNCVKKDKNGKCPPLPKSPKPTPKKPVEAK